MLTVRQASEALSVSPSLVYGLVARGLLRCERYGLGRGTIRIPEDALAEYRERARATGTVFTHAAAAPPPPRCPPLKHLTLTHAAPARGGTPATGKGAGSASRASTGPSARQGAPR